ncbi:MAG TPA: pyrimidine utilization protein D [Rhodopila sp.]|uniref:pyrimidine utilization protein D n=1 Tax=Rhodopila sp. TaxID=2480087 RepID=UPI002C72AA19|nr:pyrimidine utilization protein D [Rhodopila sp.]HVY18190.1 pyrimidine utilization protein D [Rhodopila sp.]
MHYEIHGADNRPTVLLSSGLGGAAQYWIPNLPTLAARFRVITYDQSGTGRSPAELPDGYAMADMAADVASLLDNLGIERCHFVGHALGGLIGLQLAVMRPTLLDRMVLVNAWAKTHPHTLRCFAARKNLLLNSGTTAYVAAQPLFLYPPDWMASRTAWLAEQDAAGVTHFPGAESVLRRIGAIEAFDLSDQVGQIPHPTCVIAARDDMLVPSGCSVALAEALPNGELVLFERGGHACNVTDADGFDAALLAFLGR